MTTETIRLDMTWKAAANCLALILADGTPEGQASARAELARMADTADRARELAEQVAAIREALRPVAEMQGADSAILDAFKLCTGGLAPRGADV